MSEGQSGEARGSVGRTLSQVEAVTLAVYALGRESLQVDTEDIAW